jgi:hypothetical protein
VLQLHTSNPTSDGRYKTRYAEIPVVSLITALHFVTLVDSLLPEVGEIATSLVDFWLKTLESTVAVDLRLVSLDVVRELDHLQLIIEFFGSRWPELESLFLWGQWVSIRDSLVNKYVPIHLTMEVDSFIENTITLAQYSHLCCGEGEFVYADDSRLYV